MSSGPAPMFSRRDLISLAVPLMLEQLLAVTVGMADTVMVTVAGEAAVSGISLVDSINFLLIQLFAAMATGGAVVCSQYMGRGDNENASASAKQLLYCTVFFSLLVAVAAIVFNAPLLRLIFGSIEPDVMENASTYFWLSALSYPVLAIYNAGAAFFRSMGKTRITLYIAVIVNVLNVGGNALLIYGFGMGVAGAGTASLLSRAAAAVIILLLLCKGEYPIHLRGLFRYKPDFPMLKRILAIGIPTGAENSLFQLGKLLLSGLIATFGTASIAANAITGSLGNFSNVPGSGIGLALVTVAGQCMGAGRPKEAQRYTWKLVGMTYLFMGAMDVILFTCAEPLCGLFDLSPEATSLAAVTLQGFALATVVWPLSFTIPNALRAAGDARFTMVVSLISMFLCRVALAFLLAAVTDWGLQCVWIAMYADWAFRGAVFTVRFLRGKWKLKKVI